MNIVLLLNIMINHFLFPEHSKESDIGYLWFVCVYTSWIVCVPLQFDTNAKYRESKNSPVVNFINVIRERFHMNFSTKPKRH